MKEKKGWLRHFVFVGVQLIRTYGTEGTVAFSKEKKNIAPWKIMCSAQFSMFPALLVF